MTRFVLPALWLAAASAAHAELNLGFETLDRDAMPVSWSVASAGADVASDASAIEGARSLKVTRATPGVARVTQRVPAASLRAAGPPQRAMRLRLTGSARASAPSASAAIWLRIDGPHGPLFLDSGGFAREPAAERDAAIPEASAGTSEWRRFEIELPFPPDTEEVALGVSVRGQGTAWFDGLALAAVATDGPPASPPAVRYLDAALALMREHALRRADVDWLSLRAEALEHARGAATAGEAHLAVRFAVRELGDRHSYLQSAAATRALATTAVSNARTGSPLAAPRGQRLGDSVAYVNVPGFAGGTPLQQVEFAEQVKNTIQATDGTDVCGWVVDLRQNTGGNLWPMLAGVGPLLGEGELAASVYPDGRRVPVWHRDGQAGFGDYTQLRVRAPYRLAGSSVPVAVLLGPATASSAEVLAVAFRSRAATRSFGAPTRGLSAGNRTFALADGAALVLTVAATSDNAGHVYAGPIVPDEAVARSEQPSGAESAADAVLAAAVAWLEAGDSCR
jgi:carboxyl-terminal processing protease